MLNSSVTRRQLLGPTHPPGGLGKPAGAGSHLQAEEVVGAHAVPLGLPAPAAAHRVACQACKGEGEAGEGKGGGSGLGAAPVAADAALPPPRFHPRHCAAPAARTDGGAVAGDGAHAVEAQLAQELAKHGASARHHLPLLWQHRHLVHQRHVHHNASGADAGAAGVVAAGARAQRQAPLRRKGDGGRDVGLAGAEDKHQRALFIEGEAGGKAEVSGVLVLGLALQNDLPVQAVDEGQQLALRSLQPSKGIVGGGGGGTGGSKRQQQREQTRARDPHVGGACAGRGACGRVKKGVWGTQARGHGQPPAIAPVYKVPGRTPRLRQSAIAQRHGRGVKLASGGALRLLGTHSPRRPMALLGLVVPAKRTVHSLFVSRTLAAIGEFPSDLAASGGWWPPNAARRAVGPPLPPFPTHAPPRAAARPLRRPVVDRGGSKRCEQAEGWWWRQRQLLRPLQAPCRSSPCRLSLLLAHAAHRRSLAAVEVSDEPTAGFADEGQEPPDTPADPSTPFEGVPADASTPIGEVLPAPQPIDVPATPPLPASGVCAAGQTLCDSVCVDLSTDATHCGACGASCLPPGRAAAARPILPVAPHQKGGQPRAAAAHQSGASLAPQSPPHCSSCIPAAWAPGPPPAAAGGHRCLREQRVHLHLPRGSSRVPGGPKPAALLLLLLR